MWHFLTRSEIARIRELRYGDGLTCAVVASIIGCHWTTVQKYAPGRPGKVPNDKLRAAFLASGVSASEVARRMGWVAARPAGWMPGADGSRVKRSLGLMPDLNGDGARSTRSLFDAGNGQPYG
jgi:hypothetical protein